MISSERLAEMCRVHPAQIRKDLSYFGEFGIRGVGYNVRDLLSEIKKIFSTHREWRLAIVGIGQMGTALVRHANFAQKNYRFVAAFDSDLEKIGREVTSGIVIEPFSRIRPLIRELGIEVGVVTTQPAETRNVVDLLVDAGIRAILNCSPLQVGSLENCVVENVDLTVNLEYLAYFLSESM